MRGNSPACAVLLLILGVLNADAAAWTPTNTAELITSIEIANTNAQDDLIDLGGLTFVITNAHNTAYGTNGLPLVMNDNGHLLTIQGGVIERDTNAPPFRMLCIDADALVALVDLTVARGQAVDTNSPGCFGGGIFSYGDLSARNCTVRDCLSWYAGGGFALSGYSLLTDCVVTNNESIGHPKALAGGIANWGRLDIRDSSISHNTTIYGGGIFNDSYGVLEMRNCTVSNNVVTLMGGGVFTHSNAVANIAYSRIITNQAAWGGGIHNEGELYVAFSTIHANKALSGGGAYSGAGDSTFVASTLSANTAANQAGGIYNQEGAVSLLNCTLSGNTTGGTGYGGGILNLCGTAGAVASCELRHCTVFNNIGSQVGGVCVGDNSLGFGTAAAVFGHTIVANNGGLVQIGKVRGVVSETFDGSLGYNLFSDSGPLDTPGPGNKFNVSPGLSAFLYDAGGPTKTHEPMIGSQAINAGDPAFSGVPIIDQRIYRRVASGQIDIGAVEAYSSETNLAPVQEWRLVHFGTTENEGFAANDATPGNDGIANLVKYALAFPDPRVPWYRPMSDGRSFVPGLPTPDHDGTNVWCTFLFETGRTDVVVFAEWCTNLLTAAWTNDSVTSVVEAAQEHLERRRLSVPMGADRAKFLRIKAELHGSN